MNNTANTLNRVRQLITRLRTKVRCAALFDGSTRIIIQGCLAFWATLAIDRLFEPNMIIRALVLALLAIWFIRQLYRLVFYPMFRRISDESMAQLAGRGFPDDTEAILTVISPADAEGQNPLLWEETCKAAQLTAEHILDEQRFSRIFHYRRIAKHAGTGVFLAVTIIVLAMYLPVWPQVWFSRVICLSDQLWPRYARIWVDGFAEDAINPVGKIKIARGDDLNLKVWADTNQELIPRRVNIISRDVNGRRKSAMVRQGELPRREKDSHAGWFPKFALPECLQSKTDAPIKPKRKPTPPLAFTYTLRGVLNPQTIEFRGADAVLRGLEIEVVESPLIVQAEIRQSFPPYMARKDSRTKLRSTVQIPMGTGMKLSFTANKPVMEVAAVLTNSAGQTKTLTPAISRKDPARFELDPGTIMTDESLSIELFDRDGLKSRKPIVFNFALIQDTVPSLNMVATGLGVACTMTSSFPFSGVVSDDNGVKSTRFTYSINRKEQTLTGTLPLETYPRRPLEVQLKTIFEPIKAGVQIGDSMTITIDAEDYYDLEVVRPANIGQTAPMVMEVVTPERMRMLLEAAELNIRRHFEAVFEEVKTTRDLLASIETLPDGSTTDANKPSEDEKSTEEKPTDGTFASVPVAVRLLQADRAVQNALKNKNEFLAEADAFNDLVEQMVNNKIDTPEWKQRISDDISVPLRKICNQSFVELEKRLLAFRTSLENGKWTDAPDVKTKAQQQYDLTVQQLDDVLAKMLKLEDFNEAVELLRQILKQQDELEPQMQDKNKKSLKEDLL